MAVPKKRTSKAKKNQRKAIWKNKAIKQALQAYSVSKWAAKKAEQEIN